LCCSIFSGKRGNCQGLEAASGFEPLHKGFADLSLSHLGTPPLISYTRIVNS
jgi:hypothetical protein